MLSACVGDYCDAIGSFQLELDDKGARVAYDGDNVRLTNSTALQPSMWNAVLNVNKLIAAQSGVVVGTSPFSL